MRLEFFDKKTTFVMKSDEIWLLKNKDYKTQTGKTGDLT